MLESKINSLKGELVAFASLVEKMISKGITGFLNSDKEQLDEVIYTDEPRANKFELDLDERCTSLIAQYQPKAKDLRTILMILKMNNDLERLGDLAVNICESGLMLIDLPPIDKRRNLLESIQNEALSMLHDSINSLIEGNVGLARGVCNRDSVVDDLRDTILKEMVSYMKSDTTVIEQCVHVIRIARNLERIADLSTNLCEDVLYMVDGKVIKHHSEKK